jgi:alkanesulfonate monooxygenase SsuD/methylene tetrahydromethanopterin reductase-like flavin-dependent oxidoreductase (luciferase family)
MKGGIRFGHYIFQDGLTFKKIRSTAVQCERLGFDSVWLKDNFSPWLHGWFEGWNVNPYAEFSECWTTLSALATTTKRIRLGSVLVNLYRVPSLVAKMASTLDQISGGRLELGLSAGWNEEECVSYGIAFPRSTTRVEMLEDAIKIVKKMWTAERAFYRGPHHNVRGAICQPKAVQKPHPPLWVGGKGNRTLKIAARESNGWIYGLCTKKEYLTVAERLKEECKRQRRGWATITKAWYGMVRIEENEPSVKDRGKKVLAGLYGAVTGPPSEIAEQLRDYLDVGVTYFIPTFSPADAPKQLRRFAEDVMPLVRS